MADEAHRVVVALLAENGQFDAKMKQSASSFGTSMKQIEQSAARAEARTERMAVGIGSNFRRLTTSSRNLGFQIADIGTQLSSGTSPFIVLAQQGPQVANALEGARGAVGRFASFLSGPWGAALLAGTTILGMFLLKNRDAKDAAEDAARAQRDLADAADSLGRAQSLLSQFIDLATGKQINQNEVVREAIRLQAQLAQIEAARAAREAGKALRALRPDLQTDPGAQGLATAARIPGLRALPTGSSAQAQADFDRALQTFFRNPNASVSDFRRSIEGIPGLNVNAAMQNAIVIAANRDEIRNMEDVRRIADGGAVPERFLQRADGTRKARKAGGPSAEDTQRRFENQMMSLTQRALNAEEQVAKSADERADIEWRAVEWARQQQVAEIENDEHYNDAQKRELAAIVTRIADREIEVIELRRRRDNERQAQDIADERFHAEIEALRIQHQLADTDAARKELALALVDVEDAYLRSKLEGVIASEAATDAEKERARIALEGLNATASLRRDAAGRANETEVERYLRELHKTPEQINEAIEDIQIDGLEALNDGLLDAITGARSLGDVFSDVADQIISDLLRIAIQQAIIKPLADALFGGVGAATGGPMSFLNGGGGGGGLLGGLLGSLGLRASGGPVSAGKPYLVGERGMELIVPRAPGFVVSNERLSAGAASAGGTVRLMIEEAPGFAARVRAEATGVAIDVQRQAAPHVIDAAANEAARRSVRPRL